MKVCARFVPNTLTPEKKAMRNAHPRDIISLTENDLNFLKSIVIGKKSLCFQYDSDTMRQSAEWKSQNSTEPKNQRKFHPKNLLQLDKQLQVSTT
ncbi:hypothetical protein TNCV_1092711 [Trichonephila clavipes]|nr:hypothetical protein TNCV_1092711 [Trichonephila clavipes]